MAKRRALQAMISGITSVTARPSEVGRVMGHADHAMAGFSLY